MRDIYGKPLEKGNYTFVVFLDHLPAQAYYLVLRTNENFAYQVVQKQ